MKNKVETIAGVLRAAGHPIRIQILDLLNAEGEVSVNEICKKINTDQSLTSHHLMLLTQAGYIKGTRKGKFIFYALASDKLFGILQVAKNHLAV